MVKSDLVMTLMDKEKLTEAKAKEIVDLIYDKFTETLKSGDRIEIRDFGVLP